MTCNRIDVVTFPATVVILSRSLDLQSEIVEFYYLILKYVNRVQKTHNNTYVFTFIFQSVSQ